MNCKILPTKKFLKEFKRLCKKYPSLKKEIAELSKQLHNDYTIGTSIGHNCYKIRISITSKRAGKSGGARIITCLKVSNHALYLLSIYDKAEQDTISDKEIRDRLKSEGL